MKELTRSLNYSSEGILMFLPTPISDRTVVVGNSKAKYDVSYRILSYFGPNSSIGPYYRCRRHKIFVNFRTIQLHYHIDILDVFKVFNPNSTVLKHYANNISSKLLQVVNRNGVDIVSTATTTVIRPINSKSTYAYSTGSLVIYSRLNRHFL